MEQRQNINLNAFDGSSIGRMVNVVCGERNFHSFRYINLLLNI